MAKPAFLVCDTETGGLDPRVSPLLSAANLIVDTDFKVIEGFSLKLLPPEGTVLEIPTPATMGLDNPRKKIQAHIDIYTMQERDPAPEDLRIQAYAAEINGFVKLVDGVWDADSIQEWLDQSIPLEDGTRIYRQHLRQAFTQKPILCAHNTPFDLKFLYFHLRELKEDLAVTDGGDVLFLDTCKMLRAYRKQRKMGTGAKLSDLAEFAGKPNSATAHEALEDCEDCLLGLRWLIEHAYDGTPEEGPEKLAALQSDETFWLEFWRRVKALGGPC